jgi:hypothetical protein
MFKMYKQDSNQGFTMRFRNGWTISVRWGAVNYCNNQKSSIAGKYDIITDKFDESGTAEVAVFDPLDNMDALADHDQVLGYQTAADVAMIMVETMRRGRNERAKMPKSWENEEEVVES